MLLNGTFLAELCSTVYILAGYIGQLFIYSQIFGGGVRHAGTNSSTGFKAARAVWFAATGSSGK